MVAFTDILCAWGETNSCWGVVLPIWTYNCHYFSHCSSLLCCLYFYSINQMPESFLSAFLIPDELELCFKSHPSVKVISFLPNSLHFGAAQRMALASLVFVRTYVPFQLSRRSKCLHSFCGSQISQNLTHFHYSRPHHPASHPEIIQSPEVTHIWLIP